MAHIEPRHIAAALQRVEPLSLQKAEKLADAVFASQPNLLGSILVLPRFGVSNRNIDVALKILFICLQAVRETGLDFPKVTEEIQDRCLNYVTGRARFLEGLPSDLSLEAVSEQVRVHPEPHLLAVVYGVLKDNDLLSVRTESEKYLLLAVLNLVETISNVLNDA